MARVKYVPPTPSPRHRSSRPLLPAPPRPQNNSYAQEIVSSANPYTDQAPATSTTGPNEPPANDAAAPGMALFGPRSRRNAVSGPTGPVGQMRTRSMRALDTSHALQAATQGATRRASQETSEPRQAKRRRGAARTITTETRTNASAGAAYGVGSPDFTAFQGIMMHPHLIFQFIVCIDLDDLVTLYAICKDFHAIVDSAMTAFILARAMRCAPAASVIFPFRCYRKLCIDDPYVHLDHTRDQSRLVPSFRWLRMVTWREKIARKIFVLFNNEGLYLPGPCESAIKKVWFLMDIPDNQRRIATIRNTDMWTTSDLFHAITFFMRIDMRCINPIVPVSHGCIRRMLLAQPTMSMLYRVMTRTWLTDIQEALQTYLRWKYRPTDLETHPIYGVPRSEMGRLQYEGYGVGNSQVKLQRPDELVLRECVRRGLNVKPVFFQIMNLAAPEMDEEDVGMANASA